MFGQVVATHEAAVAQMADKLLFSRMCAAMARQFVRASKSPLTALPLAFEGLLT